MLGSVPRSSLLDGCKHLYYVFAGGYLGGKGADATTQYAAYVSPSEKKWKRDGKKTIIK